MKGSTVLLGICFFFAFYGYGSETGANEYPWEQESQASRQKTSSSMEKNGPDVSGVWSCEYVYTESSTLRKVPFTLKVEAEGGRLEGKIIEPRTTFGPKNLKELEADVTGTFDAEKKEVHFTKTYTYRKGHSIIYSGSLLTENIIEGTWKIPGGWSGDWSCAR